MALLDISKAIMELQLRGGFGFWFWALRLGFRVELLASAFRVRDGESRV